MPKQRLNQLQPKQSDSITHPSPCLSQRAHGSKSVLIASALTAPFHALLSRHSVSRTPRLQSCAFCVFPGTSAAYWLLADFG